MIHFQKILKTLPKLLILAGYLFSVAFYYYSPENAGSCGCCKTHSKCSSEMHDMKCGSAEMHHKHSHTSSVNEFQVSSCSCRHDISQKQEEAPVTQPFQLQKVNPAIVAVICEDLLSSPKISIISELTSEYTAHLSDRPLFIKDLALLI